VRSLRLTLLVLSFSMAALAALAEGPTQVTVEVTLRTGGEHGTPAVAADIAATYGGRVDPASVAAGSFTLNIADTELSHLRSDSRIQSAQIAARTRHVASTLSSGNLAYVYDGAGNIIHIGSDRYLYDSVSRLKSATVNGATNTQTFSYDAFGNRTNAARIASASACLNQTACESSPTISKTTNRITSGGASYDGAGNLLALGSYTYTYDVTNTLRSSSDGSTTREFVYTAADERLAIDSHPASNTSTGTWTWTVRDLGKNVQREYASAGATGGSSGSWSKDYVWRDGLLLATETPNNIRLHFHLDHLGTPRLVTNQSGTTVGQHDYYPFGTETASSVQESPQEAIKFAGHEWDSGDINALTYMHARSYSAAMGRFLSVDRNIDQDTPQNPQKWNRYAYVNNNPINLYDPNGQQAAPGQGYVTGHGFVTRSVLDPANRPTPQMAKQIMLTYVAIGVVTYAPEGIPALLSWALSNPYQATQIVTDMLAPPGISLGSLPSNDAGLLREEIVANAIGGAVSGEKLVTSIGSTEIDVIGKSGEFIEVGGAAKGWNSATLSSFGNQLEKLKKGAAAAGVGAKAYLEAGTPQAVIDIAKKKLGEENVVIFRIINQ